MYILNNFQTFLKKKHFAPITILNLLIKSFVNHFVDIALSFCDFVNFVSSFNSFSLINFTKLAISLLLARFAYANLAVKYSAIIKLLNS